MTIYYIDATLGNDGNGGTSELTPWKSIEPKVNDAPKIAGDSFLFKRGEIWRERLEPNVSGASGNLVVYGDYGSGAKPLIKGSDLVATWTQDETSTDVILTEDTMLNANQADWNNGARTDLPMWLANHNVLMRGDFSSLSGTVISATFKGYAASSDTEDPAKTVNIHAILSGNNDWWPEGTKVNANADVGEPTWNYKEHGSPGTPWAGSAGCSTSGTDYAAATLGSFSWGAVVADEELTAVLTTATVQGWVDIPANHYGIILLASAGFLSGFHSSEHATAALRPRITVVIGTANVWKATLTTEPNQVFFDGTLGTKESAKANLNAANEWFWEANVLYVYSTSDPDTAYTDPGIEASVRDECVLADAGPDYNKLLNLDCQHANGATGANGAIRLRWGNTNWIIDTCEASWNACKGIAITAGAPGDATDNTVINSIAHDNASDGIYTNCNNQTFDGNTSYNNRGLFGSGLKMLGHLLSGGTIQYCTAYLNEDNGIHIDGDIAEADADRIGQITVQYNQCYDNDDCGIMLEKTDDGTVAQYNLCWDNANAGVALEHGADSVDVYNNVCFSNTSLQIGVDHERVSAYTHTNINIMNNIMDGDGAIKTFKMGPNVTEGSLDLDYNCHWNASGTMIDWNGVTYTQAQFANFQSTENQEAHGISQDPLMVNPSNDNFALQSSSPCRDSGVNVGLTQDYVGTSVPQGAVPDIGAYEYIYDEDEQRRRRVDGKLLIYQY